MTTDYETIRADFVGATDTDDRTFDHMCGRLQDLGWAETPTQAATGLRDWFVAEVKQNDKSLHAYGFDLTKPAEIARALSTHCRPRVWAALCGQAVR